MNRCNGPECDRAVVAKGLCGAHYQQQRRGDPLRPIGAPREVETDPVTEQIVRETYRALLDSGYEPKRLRSTPKDCPRNVAYSGPIGCQGVSIEGVRVVEPHTAPAEDFGHHGGYCRKGGERCRQGQCRSCTSLDNNLRAAVRKARLAHLSDDEIRQTTPSKRCGRCKTTKPSSEFGAYRSTPDGLHGHCRECSNETIRRTVLPETWRASAARYRARLAGVTTEKFSHAELVAHWESQGLDPDKCFYCPAPAEHIDHFFPITRDGGHEKANLLPACAFHNCSKNNKNPFDWIVPLLARVELVENPDGTAEIRFYRKPELAA